MSLAALVATAATLGVVGGVHCIAMCSVAQRVAVHGLSHGQGGGQAGGPGGGADREPVAFAARLRSPVGADLTFQFGRVSAYALLGAAAGAGSEILRVGAETLPLMRPLWATLNATLLALGLWLLVLGQQPAVLNALGERLWQIARPNRQVVAALASAGRGSASRFSSLAPSPSGRARALILGAAWALLPCGLLYSALAVAVLASEPAGGALVMLAFATGTALHLFIAQRLWHWLALRLTAAGSQRIERIGVRIGGALLASMAAVALVALALGQAHPFCLP